MKIFKDTNNQVHVIDENFTHLLPTGCVEVTQEEADVLTAPPPPPIPSIVSMRQARLALLQNGLLDDVNTAIAAGTKADQIEWEYAAEVNRLSPLVANMKTALNLTDADLDGLFTLASTL